MVEISGCSCWNRTDLSGQYFSAAGEVVLVGRAKSERGTGLTRSDAIKGDLDVTKGVIAWVTAWIGKTWHKVL